MNLKNNKGITLIALVIMVILLLVIAAVGINGSRGLADLARFEGVETDLLLIQSKCKIIAEKKAIGEITEDELYGTKQTSGDYINWYLLSEEDLKKIGLKDAKSNDGYYVDYDNDDVAYENGVTYNGTTYHKLSEMK